MSVRSIQARPSISQRLTKIWQSLKCVVLSFYSSADRQRQRAQQQLELEVETKLQQAIAKAKKHKDVDELQTAIHDAAATPGIVVTLPAITKATEELISLQNEIKFRLKFFLKTIDMKNVKANGKPLTVP